MKRWPARGLLPLLALIVACSPDAPLEPNSQSSVNASTMDSMTPEDSTAFLAEGGGPTISPQSHETPGSIAIHEGESAIVTVTGAASARCETVGVSGVISNGNIFPLGIGGCSGPGIENDGIGQVVTIGPAGADGSLAFSISSSPASQAIVGGMFPSYTVNLDDGLFDGDFNDVVLSVEIQASGPPTLACMPANVTRGEQVTCTVSGNVDEVLGWDFKGAKVKAQSASAGQQWMGTAVVGGTVTAEVRFTENGSETTKKLTADYAVDARQWPAWTITQVTGPILAVVGEMRQVPVPNRPIGLFQSDEPDPSSTPLETVGSGPNMGLVFISEPVVVDRGLIAIHPGLEPTPPGLMPGDPGYTPAHAWYDDQNGQGSGTCGPSDIAFLRQEAERHEGVTLAPNSHVGVANQVFAAEQFQQRFEEMHASSEADLRSEIGSEASDIFNKNPYRKAQRDFDKIDGPAIFAALGCTLDFKANDP